MYICENCEREHDGSYGSGRFCSRKCARGFSTKGKRKEINKKISESLKISALAENGYKKPKLYCENCEKEIPNKKGRKFNYCKNCLYQSYEYKELMHKVTKGKCGGYRKNAGRTKGGWYKNQYFDSPYEIDIAKYLDKLGIKWKRNTKRFYYIFEGQKRYYIPDFYIEDKDLYLEAKGFWHGNKKEKTLEAVRQNNLNWNFIMYKNWYKNKSIINNIVKS